MGLDDREYMREVPIYRRLTGRPDRAGGRGSRGGDHDAAGAGEQPPLNPPPTGRDYLPARPSRRRRSRRRYGREPWWAGAALATALLLYFGVRGGERLYWHLNPISAPSTAAAPTPKPKAKAPAEKPQRLRVVRVPRRVGLIRGTRLLSFGGQLTLSGTAAPSGGTVKILGRWNSGRWQTIAVAAADGRAFSFTFPLNHRGTLRIKIVQPDGYTSIGTYHVS